jgi:hypothetical protein
MPLLELIRNAAANFGIPLVAELPDLMLGILVIVVALLLLRIVFDLLGSLLKAGCTIAVLLLILWIVSAVFMAR